MNHRRLGDPRRPDRALQVPSRRLDRAYRSDGRVGAAGDNVGLLLDGIPKDLLLRGDTITN
jgi:hypothetical protein